MQASGEENWVKDIKHITINVLQNAERNRSCIQGLVPQFVCTEKTLQGPKLKLSGWTEHKGLVLPVFMFGKYIMTTAVESKGEVLLYC